MKNEPDGGPKDAIENKSTVTEPCPPVVTRRQRATSIVIAAAIVLIILVIAVSLVSRLNRPDPAEVLKGKTLRTWHTLSHWTGSKRI